ncbi:uncharacterized protein LOC144424362 [Styela clava]
MENSTVPNYTTDATLPASSWSNDSDDYQITPRIFTLNGPHFTSWMTKTVITLVLAILDSYIIVVLAIDGKRELSKSRGIDQETTGKRLGRLMRLVRFLQSISTLGFHITALVIAIGVEFKGLPGACASAKKIQAFWGSSSFILTYLVLWLRQRVIYSNPALKHLTNIVSRSLSILALAILVVGLVANYFKYALSFHHSITKFGCVVSKAYISPLTSWLMIGISTIVLQMLLLGLFLHPLRKHQSNADDGKESLKPVIQRAFFAALACTLSELISTAMTFGLGRKDAYIISIFMRIRMFMNVVTIIASFPDWKTTILPWKNYPTDQGISRTVDSSSKNIPDINCPAPPA